MLSLVHLQCLLERFYSSGPPSASRPTFWCVAPHNRGIVGEMLLKWAANGFKAYFLVSSSAWLFGWRNSWRGGGRGWSLFTCNACGAVFLGKMLLKWAAIGLKAYFLVRGSAYGLSIGVKGPVRLHSQCLRARMCVRDDAQVGCGWFHGQVCDASQCRHLEDDAAVRAALTLHQTNLPPSLPNASAPSKPASLTPTTLCCLPFTIQWLVPV